MQGHHKRRGGRGHKAHEHGGCLKTSAERKASHRRERLFEQGDLKLVVLDLLQTRPRHGLRNHQGRFEELAGGDYTPQPGVVYPTLTCWKRSAMPLLHRRDRRQETNGITPEGIAFLAGQRESLERIRSRIESAGSVV